MQNIKNQRGGTILGLIIGLVIGLAVALGVAVYVTKVPVPFVNKSQSRTVEQDAAETQKNKDWDPNAPLYGKNAAKPDAGASAPTPAGATEVKPAVSADPLGDLAKARSGAPGLEPFTYFVQVGAFRTPEDAESQRARLSLGGVQAKISEREQSGRTIWRVRVGPFDLKEDADKAKDKLSAAGHDTALVRVQR